MFLQSNKIYQNFQKRNCKPKTGKKFDSSSPIQKYDVIKLSIKLNLFTAKSRYIHFFLKSNKDRKKIYFQFSYFYKKTYLILKEYISLDKKYIYIHVYFFFYSSKIYIFFQRICYWTFLYFSTAVTGLIQLDEKIP